MSRYFMMRQDSCRACESNSYAILSRELKDDLVVEVHRCKNCGTTSEVGFKIGDVYYSDTIEYHKADIKEYDVSVEVSLIYSGRLSARSPEEAMKMFKENFNTESEYPYRKTVDMVCKCLNYECEEKQTDRVCNSEYDLKFSFKKEM